MSEKTLRERLLEKGAPKEILDRYEDQELEEFLEEEGVTEDYLAKLMEFQDYLENFEKYPRKRVGITLAEPVLELLKYFANDIEDAEGRPYPFSYFIEDALVWLLKRPELFMKFLEETYVESDSDEESEEETTQR